MFQTAQNEILQRFSDVESHFHAVCPEDTSAGAAVSKGLLFVQLYAIYEFTIRSAVQSGINAINRLSESPGSIRLELLGIALDSELQSMHATDQTKNKWENRLRFFQRMNDTNPVAVSETIMPNPGKHLAFRPAHLEIIWEVFGISQPIVPENRFLGLVAEIIEHRHAIAHGRETAASIGGRYSLADMHKKIKNTLAVCLHIVHVMNFHCSNRKNLCR